MGLWRVVTQANCRVRGEMLAYQYGVDGGCYGEGWIAIDKTRLLLRAALEGRLDGVEMRTEPVFGLAVPCCVEGVEDALLVPRETWGGGGRI